MKDITHYLSARFTKAQVRKVSAVNDDGLQGDFIIAGRNINLVVLDEAIVEFYGEKGYTRRTGKAGDLNFSNDADTIIVNRTRLSKGEYRVTAFDVIRGF